MQRRTIRAMFGALSIIALAGWCGVMAACEEKGKQTKAEAAAEKKVKDAALLDLPYPKSAGVQPRTITSSYDAAVDRTTMRLRLSGVRVTVGAQNVSSAALHLTSGHKGRVRAIDNPEGSVDGSLMVETSSPGVLAHSGAPGTVVADGRSMPLKGASGKDGYTSAGAGKEEVVRFRFPTADLVAAANAGSVTMTFGMIQLELSGQQLIDLREFASRLNPKR